MMAKSFVNGGFASALEKNSGQQAQGHSLCNPKSVSLNAAPSSSSFVVDYLVKSCGLPMESAIVASRKLQLDAKKNGKPESVLQFLRSHGFTDAHISTLV
ncbi:unnamed protein product [Linum trigynum]